LETSVGLLPLFGPVALFHDGSRNNGNLPVLTIEDRADLLFEFFEIGSRLEYRIKPRNAEFRNRDFPDSRDTVVRKLADNGIFEIVRNIKVS